MIAELLNNGKENAISGRELATLLNCNIRDITQQVERERRAKKPICASSGENPGYYLGNAEEIEDYCNRLKHRAVELFKTRQALIMALKGIAEQRQEQDTESQE